MASSSHPPAGSLVPQQLPILQAFRDAGTSGKGTRHALSDFASLSGASQAAVERVAFRYIFISNEDIDLFASLVAAPNQKRLTYIRFLRFHVHLPDYDCTACMHPETNVEMVANNITFTEGLFALLRVLRAGNSVQGDDEYRMHGMTLELSAASRSDNCHMYQSFKCSPDYPVLYPPDTLKLSTYADYQRYYTNIDQTTRERIHEHVEYLNTQQGADKTFSRGRIQGRRPLSLDFRNADKDELVVPQIDAVQTLAIRCQFPRQICPGAVLGLLGCELRHITALALEPYLPGEEARNSMMPGFVELVSHLPQGLLDLSLFLSFDLKESEYCVVTPWVLRMSEALVAASQLRRRLSVAFMVEAAWFFRCAARRIELYTLHWPKLQSLVLSTQFLSSSSEGGTTRQMLIEAGSAAFHMPQLQVMELWQTLDREEAFFQYKAYPRPTITLKARFDMQRFWTSEAEDNWNAAALR